MKKNTFSIYTDEELMAFLASGEVLAFDEIYFRYSKRLMVYFTRMLYFDRMLAEDALQDVFMKIAESPGKFDKTRSFKTWIFSVASNYCKNFYRHQKTVEEKHEEILHTHYECPYQEVMRIVRKLDNMRFKKILEETLNELSPEKKEAFILKYQEDKSLAEIAQIQDCAEGSVKSRLYYTTRILEEKLQMFNPVINKL